VRHLAAEELTWRVHVPDWQCQPVPVTGGEALSRHRHWSSVFSQESAAFSVSRGGPALSQQRRASVYKRQISYCCPDESLR